MNLICSWITTLLSTPHERYEIVACLCECPFNACTVRIFTTFQIDHQVLVIVPDVVCIVYTFLNTLTPFEVFVLVPSIIFLKLILVALIVLANTVPSFLSVSTDGNQKEVWIDSPHLLNFTRITEPIDDNGFIPNTLLIYCVNDLVDPIAHPFSATCISMLLKRFSPTLLTFRDRPTELLNLGLNILRNFERMESEWRLGEDIAHGTAATSKRSRQPNYQVGSIASDA